MSAKRSLILVVLAFLILPSCFAYSQSNYTESLTITTYYPAPYGVYRNLKLNPTSQPTTGASEGVMYYNATDHKLKIYTCIDQPGCNNFGFLNVSEGSNPAGNPGTSLVFSVHTEGDCTAAGGAPVASDTGLKQCMFPGTGISCPAGWTQYKSYFASAAQTASCWTSGYCTFCGGSCSCGQFGGGGTWSCTATATFSAFAFGDNNPSQCVSCNCNSQCGTCNCKAHLTAYTYIGCY